MASGTGLYNLRERGWDEELCDLCGVRPERLGLLSDSSTVDGQRIEELRNAALFFALGDGAASNLGSGADGAGRIAINIGTSAAVRVMRSNDEARAEQLSRGLFKYVVDEERVVIGGAVSNGGNLHRWCLRELKNRERGAGRESSGVRRCRNRRAHGSSLLGFRTRADMAGRAAGNDCRSHVSNYCRRRFACGNYEHFLPARRNLGSTTDADVPRRERSHRLRRHPPFPRVAEHSSRCFGLRYSRVCRELESSLRGAALYALQKLGHRPAPLRLGRILTPSTSARAKTSRTAPSTTSARTPPASGRDSLVCLARAENFSWAAHDREIDRPATDAAIFDERLFGDRGIHAERKSFAAMRAADIGLNDQLHIFARSV